MGPVLTPQEIAQLTKEKAKAESAAATFTNQIAAQQARAAELAVADGGFKKFFDYYDQDIIGKYDLEIKAINGLTRTNPVTEADIIATASIAGNRIQPSLPATDVVRIPEFDGTPTTTDPLNELQFIADQAPPENDIKNGYGGTSPGPTVLTKTAITSGSTTLQLEDLTTTFSIAPNSVFIVTDGPNLAVVKILTFAIQGSPVPPPYVADTTIQLIVPPSGTVALGQELLVFNGFNNTERTNKVASNPSLQPLMDYFIDLIEAKINLRIGALNSELAALNANQEPEPGTEISTAITNVNASKTFLTNYLLTTDVSDTGLASLASERGSRTTQANTRVSQITNAYTGRSKNYYNERYNAANNRANTSRGSLRLQKAAEQNATQSGSFASSLGDQADAIGSILP